MRDSLSRGEAPFVSHLLYDQVGILDDMKDDERRTGINAGLEWGTIADLIVIYVDNGISPGMEEGIAHYRGIGIPIEMRSLVSNKTKMTRSQLVKLIKDDMDKRLRELERKLAEEHSHG